MNRPDDDRQARLLALRQAWATGLPDKLADISGTWRRARANPSWSDEHAALLRMTHSLAGSAGTFGHARLGHVAKQMEEYLCQFADTGTALAPDNVEGVDRYLAELAAISAAGPDTEPDRWLDKRGGSKLDAGVSVTGNRRILIVEYEALLAEQLATQLGAFGWQVRQCRDATEARLALAEFRPVAMVVDLMLPEGDLANAQLSRQQVEQEPPALPLIAISTRSDWAARLAVVRAGADAYLVKPIDIVALIDTLERLAPDQPAAPFRILVVDDNAQLAEHYAQALSSAGMAAKALTDPAGLLDALAEHQPELVLMDLYMPGCSGIEAARVIRQDARYVSLPIVFLSTESALAKEQEAMRIGADDFLHKPIADADLIHAVSARVVRFRALTTLIQQDSLTGLYNHIAFKLRLETEIARAKRSNAPLALAMLDIDHFKLVNDRYGHPVGDRVIRGLSQLLRRRLRVIDIVGRYGGEEFAIALPETSAESARAVLDQLREQFGRLPFGDGEHTFACHFSAGLAEYPARPDLANLIDAADQALYEAKRAGRNRVCVDGDKAQEDRG